MPSRAFDTPLAAHLARLTGRGRCHNFHAVPWPSVLEAASSALAQDYRTLLGADLARIDASWPGSTVDSFFTPHGPLAEAQRKTADAFGADATFFGTGGTTASNQIALEALRHPGATVLMDCTAHQSLLFAAEALNTVPAPCAGTMESPCMDIEATADLLKQRALEGRPFDILVLSATGYDGRRLRLERALPLLIAASPTTALVIDEAWSALHAFVPAMAGRTALAVAARLARQAPVLVTHSAHKTMASLRQGAYLHVLGPAATIEKIRLARYRIHTTSPSWPILASLDLARAHAQQFAAAGFARAIALKARLEAMLREEPRTAAMLTPQEQDRYYGMDPLVLRLHVGPRARAVRDWLLSEHHVLVTIAGDHLVARLHFGVTDKDLHALANGLSRLGAGYGPPAAIPFPTGPQGFEPAIGSYSRDYIIPYPPGVPLARPGELWTDRHATALARERALGAEIYCLGPQAAARGAPAKTSETVPERPFSAFAMTKQEKRDDLFGS